MNATSSRRLLASVALSGLVLSPARALACSCVPQTVEQAKQAAIAIFEGRVTAIVDAPQSGTDMPLEKSVTLVVVRSWRGLQDTVTLRTAESGATCGYGFELGTSYLIYADGEPNNLRANSCSRTRPVSEASEDLAALGQGVLPSKLEPAKDGAPSETRRGGCASTKASANAAGLGWFGAASVGLFARRGQRRR